jgi:NAD(P)-dependent dehydrogenase (short-subunit alcohol dehydrogenase family)
VTKAAIIVTGAAGGIGSAVAARLAGLGQPLVLIDRVAAPLPPGAQGLAVACDIAAPPAVAAAFDRIGAEIGAVGAVVNVAGRNLTARIEEMRLDDWSAMIDVNVGGMLAVTQAALPLMEGVGDAAIVNTASVAGYMASADHPAYVATKAGVEALTQALARALGPRGIRVHAIAPGWVDAGFTHAATAALGRAEAEALTARAAAQHLLGRIAQPAEIADAIAWLLSPGARHLNGTTLFVDGGLMRVH